MKSLEVLIQKWGVENLEALPPYGESIVRSTFLELGIEPPLDLMLLYKSIGGMAVADGNLWRLWSLSEVQERRSEANEFGALFSDYLLDSWAYRVKPISSDTTAVYLDYFDGRQPILVAESLEQFFDQYLHDAEELLTGH